MSKVSYQCKIGLELILSIVLVIVFTISSIFHCLSHHAWTQKHGGFFLSLSLAFGILEVFVTISIIYKSRLQHPLSPIWSALLSRIINFFQHPTMSLLTSLTSFHFYCILLASLTLSKCFLVILHVLVTSLKLDHDVT